MSIVEKIDSMGKPYWIGLMVLGFIVFWPAGLALLAFLMWSGRMGCWSKSKGKWWKAENRSNGTGNSAFDEYKAETLRRLEEEQQEFMDFLERLRKAKDKAEFDQFMAEQKRPRGDGPTAGSEPAGA